MALIGQWAAFVAAWFIDLRATTAGWVPKWYSTYRFWLTLAVGSSIIATLAGTNYYAPGSRSTLGGTASKLAEEVKADGPTKMKLMQQSAHGNKGGVIKHKEVGGDVEATSAGAKGDSYVTIGNPKRKEEERKEKEEEERKKKEEEANKKKEDEAKKGGNDEKKDDKKDEGDEVRTRRTSELDRRCTPVALVPSCPTRQLSELCTYDASFERSNKHFTTRWLTRCGKRRLRMSARVTSTMLRK